MHYVYGDGSAGSAAIKRDNPDMTDYVSAQAIDKMKTYGVVEPLNTKSHAIGEMTDERWKAFFDVMSAQNIYPSYFQYQDSYTLKFIHDLRTDGEHLFRIGFITVPKPSKDASPAPAPSAP